MALATMFKVPSSTLNKLISGRKYMGGAELEKYREEMKHKGVEIKKKRDMKLGGHKVSEQPRLSTLTSTSSQAVMHHD